MLAVVCAAVPVAVAVDGCVTGEGPREEVTSDLPLNPRTSVADLEWVIAGPVAGMSLRGGVG
jgi:hypothetical protein